MVGNYLDTSAQLSPAEAEAIKRNTKRVDQLFERFGVLPASNGMYDTNGTIAPARRELLDASYRYLMHKEGYYAVLGEEDNKLLNSYHMYDGTPIRQRLDTLLRP